MAVEPLWPLIDPGVQCVPHHWWHNLLFLNSIWPNLCMPWTWYIGADWLYYAASPLLLLLLDRHARLGTAAAVGLIVGSVAMTGVVMVRDSHPPTHMIWTQDWSKYAGDVLDFHAHFYTQPHLRAAPYVIGLLLGRRLAATNSKLQDDQSSSSSNMAIFAGLVWCVYGVYPALHASFAGQLWSFYCVVYGAVHRAVFAACVAALIHTCHTQPTLLVNQLLRHRMFVPLANVSFGAYLVNMVPIVAVFSQGAFPWHWTGHGKQPLAVAVQLIIIFSIGAWLALAVEYPAMNVERWVRLRRCREGTRRAEKVSGDDAQEQLTGAMQIL